MGARPNVWPEAKIARGHALWDEGETVNQIALALGVTRNAVVGLAHRRGWAARPSPIRRGGVAEPIVKRAPKAALAVLPSAVLKPATPTPVVPTPLPSPTVVPAVVRRPQTATTVREQPADGRPSPVVVEPEAPTTVFRRRRPSPCLWTEGERGRFVFCDAPATVGRWCEAHSVRALAGATRDVFTPGGILVPAVVKPKVVVAKPPVRQKPSMRAIDLTGQRFGNLVVQSRAEIVAGQEAKWRCLCDCGQVSKSVRGSNLRSGNTMRCLACSVTAKRTRMRERNTAVVPEARA